MNEDMWDGQWRLMRVHAKEWWTRLTDSDLDSVTGKRDLLVSLLERKYGWSRAQAEEEIDRRTKETEGGPVHTM